MASSQLFLFSGENTFALSAELRRWKQGFREKYGDENLTQMSAKDTTFSNLLDAVSAMPFVAEKRLVVLEGLPKIDRSEVPKVIEAMHPQVILAIVESKPDKRLGIVKDLQELCTQKSFPVLSDHDAVAWVMMRAKESGASISQAAAQELIETVGSDQWVLEHEIEKLALYRKGNDIRSEDIEEMAVPGGTQVIWRLTDLLGAGNAEGALRFFRGRIDRGEDPYGLWAILLNMLKNLTLVSAALAAGKTDERSISGATGMHFLAVRGLLRLAKSLDASRIYALLASAVEADQELKTGGYKYTAEDPIEVVTLAEKLMLACR